MKNSTSLSSNMQENLLLLLAFDDISTPDILQILEAGHFGSDLYKRIAQVCIDYYHKYKTTPKNHIADLLELELGEAGTKGKVYQDTIVSLYESSKELDNFNRKYIVGQLEKFVKLQTLKSAITDSVSYVTLDDLESAERVLSQALSTRLAKSETGFALFDVSKSFGFYNQEFDVFPTGISQLDEIEVGPTRQELLIILAPPNRGKTHFLVHLGKHAAANRKKVLHISLEMSEEKMAQRYFQSLFGMTKRKIDVPITTFLEDELHRLSGFSTKILSDRPFINDPGSSIWLKNSIQRLSTKLPIWIKRFPPSFLTITGLENYLDGLERSQNYMPDLILLDYADLMKLDQRNLRISIGETYKELRRVAVERNIAVVTASQSNRLGENARVLGLEHLGEDYSKAATADNIIAYMQTIQENRLNLGRLLIAKARNEERDKNLLISQSYRMSQFCVDSRWLEDAYWGYVGLGQGREAGNTVDYNESHQREELPPARNTRHTHTTSAQQEAPIVARRRLRTTS